MARSGYSAATMTVTLSEAVTINSNDYGSTQSFTVASIANVDRRIFSATTTEQTIMTFSSVMAAGQSIPASVQYIRFTNLDDTNHIGLIFKNENDDEFGVKLDKGQSFIYNGDIAGGVVDTMDAQDGGADLGANTFADLVNVTAIADTAACDMEILVAST